MVVVVVLVIALGVYVWYRGEQRKKELADWARRRGLSFSADRDKWLDSRFPPFAAFEDGSNRYGYNIMAGSFKDRPVTAFDYHYETYTRDEHGHRETHTHRFSAVIVDAELPVKSLFIRTETLLDKVGEFIGFDDIDFESAEFSRTFCVKAPDKRWAFDVLHQEAMEYLLKAPRYMIEMQKGFVMVWRKRTFSTNEFQEAILLADGLLKRLPPSVVEELKGLRS